MEGADTATIVAAATVGGAVMFAVMKFVNSFVSSESTPVVRNESKLKPKAKKSSKKKSKKSKAKPAVKKSASAPKKAEKSKKVTIQEPEKVEVKKKKRKKKKAKKVVVVESDSSDDSDDENAVKVTKKKVEAKPVLKASDFYKKNAKAEDGWTTVPVNEFKQKVYTSGNNDGDGRSAKKKEVREVVPIGDHIGIVLGESGSTINNIQKVSGAKVTINKETKLCVISGDEESVAVGKQLVVSLISNQAKHTFEIESRLDKAILSKQDTKQSLRDLSGAKVEYLFGKQKDDKMTVIITGETEKVEMAKKLVKSYLEGKTPEGGDGVKRIKVTGFQGRILIGSKGSQINHLQRESGASINVEFLDENKLAVVSVIGDEDQINSGLEMIQSFLVEHNVKAKVELESDARGVLSKLNELRKEIPNLQVDVSNDRTEILLCGSAQGIREGNDLLLNWISKELGPPVLHKDEVMEAIELGGSAGKVIGKGRSVLNNIVANSGAKIDIKKGTLCYIYGKAAAVKKASKDVNDIVKKHNLVVSKSQEEEEELQNASWVVVQDTQMNVSKTTAAPESDWGGFRLSQSQGW